MDYMTMTKGFNPIKLGNVIVKKISGSINHFIDEPVFATYNIGRYFENGSKWGDAFLVDVLGCNLRCAHCFSHEDALAGHVDSDFVQSRQNNLPRRFQNSAINSADEIFDYLMERRSRKKIDAIEFTGCEPSFYRGGLKRFAELIQNTKQGITVGVNTNGLLIAEFTHYLDAFEGLQNTLYFYVSTKGTNSEEFRRFTEADGSYYMHPFIAIQRLLERGFRTIPGGVTLNTFADVRSLKLKENPATRLHSLLSSIHPDLPRMISYDCITYGRVYQPEKQLERMKEREYTHCKPSLVKNALLDYFKEKGTPIIRSGKGELPGMVTKKETLDKILSSQKPR